MRIETSDFSNTPSHFEKKAILGQIMRFWNMYVNIEIEIYVCLTLRFEEYASKKTHKYFTSPFTNHGLCNHNLHLIYNFPYYYITIL